MAEESFPSFLAGKYFSSETALPPLVGRHALDLQFDHPDFNFPVDNDLPLMCGGQPTHLDSYASSANSPGDNIGSATSDDEVRHNDYYWNSSQQPTLQMISRFAPPSFPMHAPNLQVGAPLMDPGRVPSPAGSSHSSDSGTINLQGKPAAAKPEKRTAHNAIERKYRNSINDQITGLKSLLPPSLVSAHNSKANKATILKKASDYIVHLQRVNQALLQDNSRMSTLLSQNGIDPTRMPVMHPHGFQSSAMTSLHAPSMHSDNRPRILLCALVLGLCSLHLLPSSVDVTPASASASGRVLLSVDTSTFLLSLIWAFLAFVSRAVLVLCGVFWLLRDSGSDDVPVTNAEVSSFTRIFLSARIAFQVLRYMVLSICGPKIAAMLCGNIAPSIPMKAFSQSQTQRGLWGHLLAWRALNSSFGASALSVTDRAHIFVGAAVQSMDLFQGQSSYLASLLLGHAREVFPKHWACTAGGSEFILRGKWLAKSRPSLRDVHTAFCADTTAAVLQDLLTGSHDDAEEHLQTLRDCGSAADAELAGVLVQHRAGRHLEAAERLAALDTPTGDVPHTIVMLLQAGQAFEACAPAMLDAAVRDACRRACGVLRPALLSAPNDGVEKLWVLIGWRQLLAARVALLRVQQASVERNANTETELLAELQSDVSFLRPFSADPRVACLAHLYSGVARSLANSNAHPTRHLFVESMKSARKCGFSYDEGLALLEMCICLRNALPVSMMRVNLEKAINVFQCVGAMDELQTARCMLRLATATA